MAGPERNMGLLRAVVERGRVLPRRPQRSDTESRVNPGDVKRAETMHCEDFLSRHGEYVDGMLSLVEASQLRGHMAECSNCARYDRIVRKGLTLVTELPEIQPSLDFEQRLQHRIFHLEDEMTFTQQRPAVGVAAALAVAAMIALLAWSPLLIQRATTAASVAQERVEPSYQPLGYNTPEMGIPQWYTTIPVGTPVTAAGAATLIGRQAIEPGPYNPLIVQPPMRAVRTVSRTAPN